MDQSLPDNLYTIAVDIGVSDIDTFFELLGGSCWAMITKKNSITKTRFNTYALFDKIGQCLNTHHPNYIKNTQYENELMFHNQIYHNRQIILDEDNDQIILYMFKSGGYKVVATKDRACKCKCGQYSITTYCSYEFLSGAMGLSRLTISNMASKL